MKKRLLAIGIVFALSVSMLGPTGTIVGYAAQMNAENEAADQDEKALNDWEIASQKVNSYRDIEDEEPPVIIRKNAASKHGIMALSTSYDPRNEAEADSIPAVRNQGSLGTCWAHSAQSMIEMDLWRQGTLNADDMSEFQTVYFMNHDWEDPLGLCSNDNFHTTDGTSALSATWYGKGGNTAYTKYMLMDWVGALSERDYPETAYSALEAQKADAYLEDDYAINKDAAHVQDVYVINTKDSATIKEMVKEHGAVGISYYHNGQTTAENGGTTQQLYYNAEKAAYYYDGETESTNHAVAIVGWDDDFSSSNFNSHHQPANNGAWLVRNSWGATWGDEGYFWISYEDKSLANVAYAVVAVAKGSEDYYDHNYQYDGGIYEGSVVYSDLKAEGDGIEMANVFTAQSDEVLEAVAAYVSAGDTYEIEIYKNLEDSTDPTKGILVHSQQGNPDEPMLEGYHTIKLDKKIELEAEDTFSVVVRLVNTITKSARVYLDKDLTTAWISSKVEVNAGESFYRYYSSQGKNYVWNDAFTKSGNVRVKAYTVLKKQPKIKEGAAVSLVDAQLIEGQPLSSLTFDAVEFVDDNGKTVEGSLEFKDPEYKPEEGITTAEWVFTPDDVRYIQCMGTLSITVLSNKIAIENKDYETTYMYRDTISEPSKDNFTINSPGTISDDEMDWTFKWESEDGTEITSPPSDVGKYTLIVTVKSQTDPRSGVLELPVTISKLTLTRDDFQVKLPGNGTIEYNGQPQQAEVTCEMIEDFTVKYKSGTGVTEETPTEPGTYTVMIDYNKNQNITKIQDMVVGSFVITKKAAFEKHVTENYNYTVNGGLTGESIDLTGYLPEDLGKTSFRLISESWDINEFPEGIDVTEEGVLIYKVNTSEAYSALPVTVRVMVINSEYYNDSEILFTIQLTVKKAPNTEGDTTAPTENPVTPSKPTESPAAPTKPTEEPKRASIGTVLKDSSGASYKVTSVDTVAYKKPVNKSLTKVTIPDKVTINGKKYQVTSIDNNAFSGYSKLKSVKIGKNITSIGSKAFYKCKSLTNVTIPAKVKKIGKQAFADCKKLKKITIKTTKLTSKSVGKNAFKGIYKKPTVTVPKKKKKVYKKLLKAKGVPAKAKIK